MGCLIRNFSLTWSLYKKHIRREIEKVVSNIWDTVVLRLAKNLAFLEKKGCIIFSCQLLIDKHLSKCQNNVATFSCCCKDKHFLESIENKLTHFIYSYLLFIY